MVKAETQNTTSKQGKHAWISKKCANTHEENNLTLTLSAKRIFFEIFSLFSENESELKRACFC